MEDLREALQEIVAKKIEDGKSLEEVIFSSFVEDRNICDLTTFFDIDSKLFLAMLLRLSYINNFDEAYRLSQDIFRSIPEKNSIFEDEDAYLATIIPLSQLSVEELNEMVSSQNPRIKRKKEFIDYYLQYKNAMDDLLSVLRIIADSVAKAIIFFDFNTDKESYKKLQTIMNTIVEHAKNLERERKNSRKEIIKQQEAAKKRLKTLDSLTEDTYLEITEDEINYYPLETLKMLTYFTIKHNENIYHRIQTELSKYNASTHIQINSLLKKYNISYELNYEELSEVASANDLEGLEKKLEYLKLTDVKLDKESFIYFVTNIKLSDIKAIQSYRLQNIISLEYLQENFMTIYMSIGLICYNYEILLSMFKDKSRLGTELNELLLSESNNLINNINLGFAYDLPYSEKNEIFKYIMKPYFFEVIDVWIELGYFKELMNNLYIYENNPIRLTKRIVLASRMKMSIFDENGQIRAELLSDKSYLNDSIVEKSLENVSGNYMNNITNEKEEELSCLERYKVDNQTYNIGGILISRPKVSRYYRGNLLEAILYGSIKTLEECETLTTELNQRKELSLEKTVAKQ